MQLSNRNPSSGVLTNQTEFVLIKIVFAIFTSGFQPGSADTATPIFIQKKKKNPLPPDQSYHHPL